MLSSRRAARALAALVAAAAAAAASPAAAVASAGDGRVRWGSVGGPRPGDLVRCGGGAGAGGADDPCRPPDVVDITVAAVTPYVSWPSRPALFRCRTSGAAVAY